ncbi:MAG: exo-alpha-sialidase [Clostridia bacterium]|nr:exo-alpha-sialidase [Clostridia bacterium]
MKGYSKWSYSPYRPFFFEVGDIYISRIAPSDNSVHFEWLSEGFGEYSVYYKKRGDSDFLLSGSTRSNEYNITGLLSDTDYEFYVSAEIGKSRVRLARTGTPVGTVVNYLHPDDEAYSFSGRYLCSPSLVRHPDGFLLASMDLFRGEAPQNLTLIFRSDDDGESWHYVSELMPCFWGKMFIHKGDVYMLACSTEYGDLLIGKSSDGGKTFSAPISLLRGSGGKAKGVGVHKNPQNIVRHNGRIYNTLEWGSWGVGYHAPMVMSADENDDLLNPESWEFSEPVKYDPTWPGTAHGESSGNIEGTLAVSPDGKLFNIMRYDMTKTLEKYGLALAYEVDKENPGAKLKYSHAIKFPANHSKFTIQYDPVSKRYYTLASRITDVNNNYDRRLLSLMVSSDLENWSVLLDVLDRRDAGVNEVGFQYVDFIIENDDIIFLCRTAINNAHNFHDANYSTFHGIKNFRSLLD